MNPDSGLGLSDLQAILFDFDGTLVELRIDFDAMKRRVREVALALGADLTGCERLYTLELIERVSSELERRDPELAERFRQQAETAVIDEDMKGAAEAEVYPGVPELLHMLHDRNVRVGIVTRNCRQAVEQIIARSDLPYDVLLTRDDVPRVKPDPLHLEIALRALHASPSRTLMVGDHLADIEAGQAVGAWTVGILNSNRPPDYFAAVHPDAILSSVVDILVYLAAHPLRRS